MRDPEREVGYGITDSWDEIVETLQGAPVSTDMELGGYVREFESRVRQDMDEIYTRLDDEQTERQLLAGRLNMLFRDRRAHAYTRLLMEAEARMSREAWTRATDASDLVHGEVISLRTTVLGQISELLRLEHRRSTETLESRTALQGQITALQGQVTALQAQVATFNTRNNNNHNITQIITYINFSQYSCITAPTPIIPNTWNTHMSQASMEYQFLRRSSLTHPMYTQSLNIIKLHLNGNMRQFLLEETH
nr:hypothetical protein [Tanacetum cinerariifolium]